MNRAKPRHLSSRSVPYNFRKPGCYFKQPIHGLCRVTLSDARRAESGEASGMMMEICHAHDIAPVGRHPAACGGGPAVFRPGDFNGVIQALIDSNSLVSCGMLDERKVGTCGPAWSGRSCSGAGPDLHARQGRGAGAGRGSAISGRVERRGSNPAVPDLRGIRHEGRQAMADFENYSFSATVGTEVLGVIPDVAQKKSTVVRPMSIRRASRQCYSNPRPPTGPTCARDSAAAAHAGARARLTGP